VLEDLGLDLVRGHPGVREAHSAEPVQHVESEQVHGHLAGAAEGPVPVLVHVTGLVVQAPVALVHKMRHVHQVRRGAGGDHDRVAGVHVSGADLCVGAVPLGLHPIARGEGGQVRAVVKDRVPHPQEAGGVVQFADHFGGHGEDGLVRGDLGAGSGQVAHRALPLLEGGLACHEVRSLHRIVNPRHDLPRLTLVGHHNVDQPTEGIGDRCLGALQGELPIDFRRPGPFRVAPQTAGGGADAGLQFEFSRVRGNAYGEHFARRGV